MPDLDFPAKTKAPAVTGTPLERIARLADVIREGGDRAQELRRLPQDTVDALIDAGIFRIAIPRELGGDDASITETVEILAAIAAIDASVGWNVMLGSEINAMVAGGMDKTLAKEVFLDDPRVVMCGGGERAIPPVSFHNAETVKVAERLRDASGYLMQQCPSYCFIYPYGYKELETISLAGKIDLALADIKAGVAFGEGMPLFRAFAWLGRKVSR